jgi:integrase
MSRIAGVFQRHSRSCRRGPRCGCSWAYSLELPAGDGPRRQVTKSGFKSQKAAAEARREAAEVYDDPDVSVEFGRMTVAAWLDKWLEMRTDPHGERPLRPSTAACYLSHIETEWKPQIGNVRLRDLTASRIEAVHRHLRRKGLSEATVHRYYATLRKAIKDAYRKGYIARNPLDRVELGKVTRANLDVWTLDEWQKFAEATNEDRLAPLYRLAVDAGMRRGELCGLRWSDVDLDAGKVTVSHTLVQIGSKVVQSVPKTDAGTDRTVHLTQGTITALKSWKAVQARERLAAGDAWADTGLVFTDALGKPLQPKSLYQRFVRTAAKAGLRPIRLHDLRHLSASLGYAAGEDEWQISRRLGHSDPSFTKRVYTDLWESTKAEGASKRASLLDTGTDN